MRWGCGAQVLELVWYFQKEKKGRIIVIVIIARYHQLPLISLNPAFPSLPSPLYISTFLSLHFYLPSQGEARRKGGAYPSIGVVFVYIYISIERSFRSQGANSRALRARGGGGMGRELSTYLPTYLLIY